MARELRSAVPGISQLNRLRAGTTPSVVIGGLKIRFALHGSVAIGRRAAEFQQTSKTSPRTEFAIGRQLYCSIPTVNVGTFSGAWDISNSIAAGDAVLFVGAGLSVDAGAPNWDAFIDVLRSALDPPTSESDPLLVAQFYRNQFGDHRLHSLLRQTLCQPAIRFSESHKIISTLPITAFCTTNYDTLLEDALRASGKSVHVISTDRELAYWNESRETQILKLHGDINNASTVVLGLDDYVRFARNNAAMQRKLVDLLSYRSVTFLGYSLRDPNVSLLFNLTHHDFSGAKRNAFMLTLEEPDSHLSREFARRGIDTCVLPGRELPPKTRLSNALSVISKQVSSLNNPSGCDLLIVDDEPLVRLVISEVVERHLPNLRVHFAADGFEASLAIGRLRPRLLWADLHMPRMQGERLIELVRELPELASMRIVICSGYCSDATREFAKEKRVDRVFEKPFSPKQAVQTIAELLRAEL